MGTSTTDLASSNISAFASPCSVSLKINATSVMLYRNVYLKDNGKQRGLSGQEYLCSFSIHETDIPLDFHSQLRLATTGQPERYAMLMQTIQTRALEPARQRKQERERLEQLSWMKGLVSFAHQQMSAAADYAHRDRHVANPEIQQEVRRVLHDAQRLLVLPAVVEAPVETAPDFTLSEQRLFQLLESINDACVQVKAMVPMAAKHFGRGHEFASDTVRQVQQMWFNTSDAIAILNQRQQLKRPGQWSAMRQAVMQPSNGSGADIPPENSPGQCLPDSELPLCSITSDGQR